MSLSLNQPTPRLNDLLLRGGDDLSPELKEQALDDILAEFGSAPAKKAPAQTAPKPNPGFSSAPSGPLTPEAEAEAIRGSRSPSTEPLSPVTSADPQEAERIANTIAEILPDRIAEIVDGSSVKVVDYAIVPSEISSPSYTRNTALGMLLGLVLIAAIICLREIFDEKLHNEDDITQRYQFPILAVIPDLAASGTGAYRSEYEVPKKEKTT